MPLGAVFDPAGRLQAGVGHEVGPPALRHIEASLGRRPLMPLIGLGLTGAGALLIVALAISAGAHGDGLGGSPGAALDAAQFRPWFRITLLAAVGLLLSGVLTLLLAITVRIWWVGFTNRTLLPVILDARREAAGRSPVAPNPTHPRPPRDHSGAVQ